MYRIKVIPKNGEKSFYITGIANVLRGAYLIKVLSSNDKNSPADYVLESCDD